MVQQCANVHVPLPITAPVDVAGVDIAEVLWREMRWLSQQWAVMGGYCQWSGGAVWEATASGVGVQCGRLLPVEWGCSVGGYCQWSGGAVWDLFSDVSGQVLDVQSQRRLASQVVVEHTHIPHLCGGEERYRDREVRQGSGRLTLL